MPYQLSASWHSPNCILRLKSSESEHLAALRLWRDFANGCPIHRLSRGSSRKERSAYSLSLLRFQSSIFISSYSEDAAGFHSGRLWSVHYNVHCKAEVAQLNEEEGLPCTTCPTLPLNFQTLCWDSALPVSHQTECEVYSSGRLSPAGLGGGAPFVWPAQRTFTHPASRHEGGGDLQISTTYIKCISV